MGLSVIKKDGCDGNTLPEEKEDQAKLWPQYLAVLTGKTNYVLTISSLPFHSFNAAAIKQNSFPVN